MDFFCLAVSVVLFDTTESFRCNNTFCRVFIFDSSYVLSVIYFSICRFIVGLRDLHLDQMFRTTAEADGDDLDQEKLV